MIGFLVFILLVVLVLAVVNHYLFPIPQFAWGIVALAYALLGSGGVDLDVGGGRR